MYDAAGRRWVAEAIAAGVLTLDGLRNGVASTRALLPRSYSPPPVSEPQKPTPIASSGSADEAAELLDDFLIALFDLPGDTWPDLAAALPNEIYERIDRYFEILLS